MMERTFVSILLAMLFILCSNQSAELKGEMIFSGKIENPNSESIELLDLKRKVVQQIQVSTEGKFSDTFEIQEGYYYLNDGNESTPLYLKPGFNLTLSMKTTILLTLSWVIKLQVRVSQFTKEKELLKTITWLKKH